MHADLQSTRKVVMYGFTVFYCTSTVCALLAGALPRVARHRGLGARRARGRRARCAGLRALALGAERLEAVAACVPRGLHERQVRRSGSGLRSTHTRVFYRFPVPPVRCLWTSVYVYAYVSYKYCTYLSCTRDSRACTG